MADSETKDGVNDMDIQEFCKFIGLNQVEGYGELVSEKWGICCNVMDNLISFDGSGEIDGLSLVNIMESVGISEGLDQIMQSVEDRQERTGKALTKRELENHLFATVQQLPSFPIPQIFDTAINQEIEHQTTLVIGLLGRGKSALSQFLIQGVHDPEDTETFVSGDMGMSGGGVTTDFWIGHYPFMGQGQNRWITVIDTPGGNDEKLPNFENFRRLQALIKKVRYINSILLVVTAQDITRRTESLNTYLNEFALTMQQNHLASNVAVVISRGHVLVPAYFPTEARFEQALNEAIMTPLQEAFGGTVPCFRLSLSKLDYEGAPQRSDETQENATDMYERFLDVPPLDCQKMVSLETRIKRLIQKHVALEETQKQTAASLAGEIAAHTATQAVLEDTQEELGNTKTELNQTTEKLEHTAEDLDRWREKHKQAMDILERETAEHAKTRTALESERKELRDTTTKWEDEVAHHHETQEKLEIELRQHKETKRTLEDREIKLEFTTDNLDKLNKEHGELQALLDKEQRELESAKSDRDRFRDQAERKKGMCVIS